MAFVYESGEEIRSGDQVVYDGQSAEVEFVSDPDCSPGDWYVKEFGGGIMILEPEVFGRVFLARSDIDGRLIFVSRRGEPEGNYVRTPSGRPKRKRC